MIVHAPAPRTATLFDDSFLDTPRELTALAVALSETNSDWPGRTTATIALSGCDLSCPYCSAPELVARGRASTTLGRVIEHLEERRDSLEGVVISGGEPTVSPALTTLLEAIRELGMPAKLDTNGTAPEMLSSLIADGLVSFVSLDIKTTPERYDRLTRGVDVWRRVERSVSTVIGSGVDHEFRTTCYPFAVSAADLPSLAAQLHGGKRYVLQQFVARRTLDPAASSVAPIAPAELHRAAIGCAVHLPTIVRGA